MQKSDFPRLVRARLRGLAAAVGCGREDPPLPAHQLVQCNHGSGSHPHLGLSLSGNADCVRSLQIPEDSGETSQQRSARAEDGLRIYS